MQILRGAQTLEELAVWGEVSNCVEGLQITLVEVVASGVVDEELEDEDDDAIDVVVVGAVIPTRHSPRRHKPVTLVDVLQGE